MHAYKDSAQLFSVFNVRVIAAVAFNVGGLLLRGGTREVFLQKDASSEAKPLARATSKQMRHTTYRPL